MKKFTKEQVSALDLDKNLSVSANAGSGKTKILVERYLTIIKDKVLTGQCSLDEIVAITFTRKAASEMQVRVLEELDKLINVSENERFTLQLEEIRNNMVYARISTIHSFCNNLLKQYPLEANVPFNYQELDEYTNNKLIDMSIDEVLFDIIYEDGSKYDLNEQELTDNIIAVFEYEKTRKFIAQYLLNNENSIQIEQFYEQSNENILNIYLSHIFNPLINYFNLIISEYDDYYINSDDSNIDKYRAYFSHLYEYLNNSKSIDLKDYNQVYEFYRGLLSVVSDKKIGRNKFDNYLYRTLTDLGNAVYLFNVFFKNNSKQTFNNCYNECLLYINSIKNLFKLIKPISSKYLDYKLKIPALTFNDILIFTLKMLKSNQFDVRQKVQSKIKYLLIDEFQDTNYIQFEIVKMLSQNDSNSCIHPDINMFIVGDDKQSIYGFRAADVRIFEKASNYIVKSNLINFNIENYGKIDLKESFRMLPSITHLINHIFAKEMKKGNSEFEVEYKEFINGRVKIDDGIIKDNGSLNLLVNIIDKSANSDINSELDSSDTDSETESEEVVANIEAKQISNFIKKILINANGEFDVEINGKKRPPKYGDIAVISRKKNSFAKLSYYLLQSSIPYEIYGGTGFFQTTEIIELNSLLKFLVNNFDDIAFAGLLKSYMFNMDDNYLVEISLNNKKISFWEKFVEYANSHPDNLLIQRTYKLLIEFIDLSETLNISTLLNQIIEKTSLIAFVSKLPSSEQIKSNIWRFVEYVHIFESSGFKTLNDLLEQTEELIDTSKEPEAPVFSDTDSIKIMSIHASKGLEFPIVIINESNYIEKTVKAEIDKDYGIAIGYHLDDYYVSNLQENIIHKFIQLRDKEANLSEMKRLLYVAMSRAKDHLVISASIKKNSSNYSKPSNFYKLIIDNILPNSNYDNLNDLLDFLRQNNYYELEIETDDMQIYTNDTNQAVKFKNVIRFHTQVVDYKYEAIKEKKIVPKIINTKLISNQQTDIISASKITSFLKDGYGFDYKYFLGMSDTDYNLNGFAANLDNEKDQIIGTQVGTFIHDILQNMNRWCNEDYSINSLEFNKLLLQIESKYSTKLKEKVKERIINECSNIIKTKFIKSNYIKIKNGKFEIEYNLPIEQNYLIATIDLLYNDENGDLVICDWKTNNVKKPEDLSIYYKIQMMCYAYIISKLRPKQEIFKAKLLLTRLAKENIEDDNWIYNYEFQRNELIFFENLLKENNRKMTEPLEKIKFHKSFIN